MGDTGAQTPAHSVPRKGHQCIHRLRVCKTAKERDTERVTRPCGVFTGTECDTFSQLWPHRGKQMWSFSPRWSSDTRDPTSRRAAPGTGAFSRSQVPPGHSAVTSSWCAAAMREQPWAHSSVYTWALSQHLPSSQATASPRQQDPGHSHMASGKLLSLDRPQLPSSVKGTAASPRTQK